MRDVRCGTCRALLFRAGHGAIANDIEIKCRRLIALVHFRGLTMKRLGLFSFIAVALASGALAQASITRAPNSGFIESYRAYIGHDDLYNSSGIRLTRPWQIIRQDRANFHQYGIRNRGDEGDSFFRDPINRQALEQMLANGTMTREAANMIVRGNVWIDVTIYGRGNWGRWIDVVVSY